MQFRKGGPIIGMQVEHEYGSYAVDEDYMVFLKEVWESAAVSSSVLREGCGFKSQCQRDTVWAFLGKIHAELLAY